MAEVRRGVRQQCRPDEEAIVGHGVRMQELPGIGKRYDVDLGRASERLSVVVRNDGTRDLYVFATPSGEPTAVIELTEEQGRKVGALLAGTFFEA